jgi:hypothetical protein
VLAQAEESIGTSLRHAVNNHYKGLDLSTAQAIRKADDDTEAAKIITAIRRGRATEVLMIAASAASGVVSGVLAQKAINNATVGGAPAAGALGLVPVVAGLAAPLSLSGRAVLTAGGLTYITGAIIYNLLTQQPAPAPAEAMG